MIEPYNNPLCLDEILAEVFAQPCWDSKALVVCNCVCRQWGTIIAQGNVDISKKIRESFPELFFFGGEEWKKYFGDVGVERPLPRNICEILSSHCPFSLETLKGTVAETHLLVLVPQKVNENSVTINLIRDLIQHPLSGNATRYESIRDEIVVQHGEIPATSNWVLLTADVLEDSRSKKYGVQKRMVSEKSQYEVPKALNVITAMVTKYISTGVRIFGCDPWTSTRCCERVNFRYGRHRIIVGCFASKGLDVHDNFCNLPAHAVAACRVF